MTLGKLLNHSITLSKCTLLLLFKKNQFPPPEKKSLSVRLLLMLNVVETAQHILALHLPGYLETGKRVNSKYPEMAILWWLCWKNVLPTLDVLSHTQTNTQCAHKWLNQHTNFSHMGLLPSVLSMHKETPNILSSRYTNPSVSFSVGLLTPFVVSKGFTNPWYTMTWAYEILKYCHTDPYTCYPKWTSMWTDQ